MGRDFLPVLRYQREGMVDCGRAADANEPDHSVWACVLGWLGGTRIVSIFFFECVLPPSPFLSLVVVDAVFVVGSRAGSIVPCLDRGRCVPSTRFPWLVFSFCGCDVLDGAKGGYTLLYHSTKIKYRGASCLFY